jgi:hypothetical protein
MEYFFGFSVREQAARSDWAKDLILFVQQEYRRSTVKAGIKPRD